MECYDREKLSVKLESEENAEEVDRSTDTGEVEARMASRSAEVRNNHLYFTSCNVLSRSSLAPAPGDAGARRMSKLSYDLLLLLEFL